MLTDFKVLSLASLVCIGMELNFEVLEMQK